MEKKFVALLAGCMVLASASMSMAVGLNSWGFDLTSIGGGSNTNVDRLDVSGSSLIVQDMPLVVGATFTESGNLGVVKGYYEPGNFTDQFNVNSNGYNLYFNTSGLTGKIDALISGGYTYKFTPGAGTIALVADADLDFSNGVFDTLATFSLVAPSGGTNVGFLGGLGPNGTSDLTAKYLTVKAGVFFDPAGKDFAAYMAEGTTVYGLMNTNNQIDALSGSDPINATVHSAGQFGTQVPEPGTFALLGAGLLGLAIAAKRRSKI